MNDHPDKNELNEDLAALEGRLASLRPQLRQAKQQEILYASAFHAGQMSVQKKLRHWQSATVASCLAIVGFAMFSLGGFTVARRPAPFVPVAISPQPQFQALGGGMFDRPVIQTELDAWQIPPLATHETEVLEPEFNPEFNPAGDLVGHPTVAQLTRLFADRNEKPSSK